MIDVHFKETSTESWLVPHRTRNKKCLGSSECLNFVDLDFFFLRETVSDLDVQALGSIPRAAIHTVM